MKRTRLISLGSTRRISRLVLAVFVFAVFFASAPQVSANGVVSHIHISDLARDLLPAGDLRELLDDPALLEAYRSGSAFPDSGYAAGDAYGEMGHWEPFTEAYIQHIRETFGPPPYESDAARQHIAFLLGQASHGMADQWFDSLFMARVQQYDGTDDTLDTYAEEFLILEHDPDNQIEGWIDAAFVNEVFTERLEYTPGEAVLEEGMGLIAAAIFILYLTAGSTYEEHWMTIPWAGTHYYLSADDAPGSLPHIAQVVASYWQVLWHRLHETDEMSQSFLLSWPPDGAENFAVERDLIETRIAAAFGHGIDRDTLTADNVRLLDESGSVVPSTTRFIYGSSFANVVLVRPSGDLEYDALYSVEIGTGLTAIDGRMLPEPISFGFRTRCSDDHLDDCPPLPDPWVAPDEPPARPDGDGDADADADAVADADAEADADADTDGDADGDGDGDADGDGDGDGDADSDGDSGGDEYFASSGGGCDCSAGNGKTSHDLWNVALFVIPLFLFLSIRRGER